MRLFCVCLWYTLILLLGLNEWFCVHDVTLFWVCGYACVSRSFVLFCNFLGSWNVYKNGSVDENELLFWLVHWMCVTISPTISYNLTAFECPSGALLDCLNTQFKKWHHSAIEFEIATMLLLFCFDFMEIGFLFFLFFCILSTFFSFLNFISLHLINILYYVLYWRFVGWFVGWSIGRFCLCFVWMCIVIN